MKSAYRLRILSLLAAFSLIAVETVYSQSRPDPPSTFDPAIIRIDEETYLGVPVNKDYLLVDESGSEFKIGEMMGQPLILVFSYYSCDGVCPTVNKQLKNTLTSIDRVLPGKDYKVLTVSFDKNDNLKSLRHFKEKIQVPVEMGDAWKIAFMKNSDDIEMLTKSVGYKFFWSRLDGIFFHPNVYIFISPSGRVMRYLYGTSIDKKDVKLAVLEASLENTAKSKLIDLLTIACYSYNFKEGKYALNYPLFISVASLFFGISLVVGSMIFYKKKIRR